MRERIRANQRRRRRLHLHLSLSLSVFQFGFLAALSLSRILDARFFSSFVPLCTSPTPVSFGPSSRASRASSFSPSSFGCRCCCPCCFSSLSWVFSSGMCVVYVLNQKNGEKRHRKRLAREAFLLLHLLYIMYLLYIMLIKNLIGLFFFFFGLVRIGDSVPVVRQMNADVLRDARLVERSSVAVTNF